MDKVRKLHPEGQLNEIDLHRDFVKNTKPEKSKKILDVKTANDWMNEAALKPKPVQLLDCLCYQGELAILFSDTNLGKSILAVQIADALTEGKAFPPFNACMMKLKTLYNDFEMSDKQFENRYSIDYQQHYQFSDNFYRSELNLDEMLVNSDKPIEEHIEEEIIDQITRKDLDVVIIDNLTYIVREIEKSRNIQPLMQRLKYITKTYGVAIIVLAHTPKRDMSKPISNVDIAGSKFLSNFADSIIAIGKSAIDEDLRYIKQVKSRNSAYLYGSSNVLVYRIVKDFNFLKFEYLRCDDENDHLRVRTKEELDQLDKQILEQHEADPEQSNQKIADKLGTNRMKVKRVIDRNKKM